MKISYEKLFLLLKKRRIKVSELRKQTMIAPNTFTRIRNNEIVTLDILMRIADCLKCDIGDICSFVSDERIIEGANK